MDGRKFKMADLDLSKWGPAGAVIFVVLLVTGQSTGLVPSPGNNSVTLHPSEMQMLAGRISDQSTNIRQIATRVSDNQGEINNFEIRVNTVERTVDLISERQDAIRVQSAQLQQSLRDIEGAIAAMTRNQDVLNVKLSAIGERIGVTTPSKR